MKLAACLLAVGLALVVGFIWGKHEAAPAVSLTHSSPLSVHQALPSSPAVARTAPFLVQSEWQEYRQAREKVLHDNQALALEYQSLLEEAKAQENSFDAAMIKADPKVAPIVAKLEKLRLRNSVATR